MSPVGLVFLLLGAVCSVQCCVVIHTGKLPNSFLIGEEAEKPPRLHAESTTKKKSSEEERRESKRKKSMSLFGSLAAENSKVSEENENVDSEIALFIAEKFRKMYDALLGKMKKSDEGGGGHKKTFSTSKSKNRNKYSDEQKQPMYDMDEEKLKSIFFPDRDNPFY